MAGEIQWWGYLHTNGTIQVTRWFDDPRDLQEARESPFVTRVVGPFEAEGRADAITIAAEKLGVPHGKGN